MTRKTDTVRRIDMGVGGTAATGGEVLGSTPSFGAPAVPIPGAPEELTLVSNSVARSSASAIVLVVVSWRPPNGIPAAQYLVEVATDSGFTTIILRNTFASTSATLELKPATNVWIRVYAQSNTGTSAPSASLAVTTASDTSSAAQPTGLAAAFIGAGDLEVTWTNPTTENFRHVEIRIWNSAAKGVLYHTDYSATGRYVWTAAENRQAGSGTPDASVYLELRSVTWYGVINSSSPPSATATKSVPGNVAGLAVDFTGPDLIVTWTVASDAEHYRLTLDGVQMPKVFGGRYMYSYDQNRQQHSGTADPSISVSLVAVDALDQVSAAAATTTATNAAPSAPASVTLNPGFSAFMASVSATEPADFLTYRWRIVQTNPSAADVTYDDRATLQTRAVTAAATYQVGVRVVDAFAQQSGETLSSTAALDALTLSDLRLDISYRDSISSTSSALDAMKDGETASGGVLYAA